MWTLACRVHNEIKSFAHLKSLDPIQRPPAIHPALTGDGFNHQLHISRVHDISGEISFILANLHIFGLIVLGVEVLTLLAPPFSQYQRPVFLHQRASHYMLSIFCLTLRRMWEWLLDSHKITRRIHQFLSITSLQPPYHLIRSQIISSANNGNIQIDLNRLLS